MAQRAWCVTFNNPPEDFDLKDGELLRYASWQLESGESGTRHIQAYVELHRPARISQVQRLFGEGAKPHCEPRRGTRDQAREYTRKEESRVDGPFEVGIWAAGGAGARADVAALVDMAKSGKSVVDAWEAFPGEMMRLHRGFAAARLAYASAGEFGARKQPRVVVLFGDSGTGKTTEAERLAAEHGGAIYRKEPGDWWCGYDMHPVVIIDEFYGGIRYSVLLRVLDRWNCSVQPKGGSVPFCGELIIISSNKHPSDWYSSVPYKTPLFRRFTQVFHYAIGKQPYDATHEFSLLEAAPEGPAPVDSFCASSSGAGQY